MTIFYYDVSSFQGQTQLPSDCAAIVAKATEGTYYHDSEYAWFKQQAANRGLPFSGYHFLKAESDPAAQARYYHDFAGNTPCMLDVETEGSSLPTVDQVLKFIEALHGLGGHVWGVYMPRWYWSQVGGNLGLVEAAGAVLISSNYTSYSDDGPGWQPYGGATPTMWQFTSSPLDKNAFKGTPAELAAIINGGSTDMDPSTKLTFSPAVNGFYPDISTEGFTGSTDANTVWTWTAARVAHVIHQVEKVQATVSDLEAKLSALPTGGGAVLNAQQVADLVIAELKAKL